MHLEVVKERNLHSPKKASIKKREWNQGQPRERSDHSDPRSDVAKRRLDELGAQQQLVQGSAKNQREVFALGSLGIGLISRDAHLCLNGLGAVPIYLLGTETGRAHLAGRALRLNFS